MPLSDVWRNHEGSLPPRFCEIWLLESSCEFLPRSFPGLWECVGKAAPERGRGREELESPEDGLCCQDSVPLRASEVVVNGDDRSKEPDGGGIAILSSGGDIFAGDCSLSPLDETDLEGVKV